MHPKSPDRRILAISLRSRRFGFAVFEGPNRLLDWGVVFYPLNDSARGAAASKRVVSLLTLFMPSMVIVGKARLLDDRNGSGTRTVLGSIRREASSRVIPVHVMEGAKLKEACRLFHAKSKHEIASALAQAFPEILWKLPPKRKIWESEHPRMVMFDAIALGFAYWQRYGARDQTAD